MRRLQKHVESHWPLALDPRLVVVIDDRFLAVALRDDLDLHGLVVSPMAPSAPPGMISGAAPLAPMIAR